MILIAGRLMTDLMCRVGVMSTGQKCARVGIMKVIITMLDSVYTHSILVNVDARACPIVAEHLYNEPLAR